MTPLLIADAQPRYEFENVTKKRVSIVESKNTVRTISPESTNLLDSSTFTPNANSVSNKISSKLSSATILADKLLTDVTNVGNNFVKLYSKDINKAAHAERYLNVDKP